MARLADRSIKKGRFTPSKNVISHIQLRLQWVKQPGYVGQVLNLRKYSSQCVDIVHNVGNKLIFIMGGNSL